MPFGIAIDRIVIVDRITGPRVHMFSQPRQEPLAVAYREGEQLRIVDDAGEHIYPATAVLGLHFETAPNYTNASVALWQDHGNGHDGVPYLYLVDPHKPDVAYAIAPHWLAMSGATFRTLASAVITGAVDMKTITSHVTSDDDLVDPVHVATWHHAADRVSVVTDPHRGAIAGPLAAAFIGPDDMNTETRTR